MLTIAAHAEETARRQGEGYHVHDSKDTWDGWTLEAVREILTRVEWPFFNFSATTFATVASTKGYAVDNILAVASIAEQGTDAEPLIGTTRNELKRMAADLEETGTPTHWYPDSFASDAITISLWPVPTAAVTYEVKAFGDGVDLTESSNIPLPETLEACIRHHVVAAYRDTIGDSEGYARSLRSFERALRQADNRYRMSEGQRLQFSASDLSGLYHTSPARRELTIP